MAKRVSVDKWLFTVTLLLVFIGLVMVFSASAVMAKERFGSPYGFLLRQMAWAGAGIVAMLAVMNIDYKKYRRPSVVFTFLGFACLLLIAVFLFRDSHNTHRWIKFGGFSFQPSELAKPALILYLAYFLESRWQQITDWKHVLVPAAAPTLLLALLIVKEPDLGTAIACMAISASVLFVAGMNMRYLWYALAALLPDRSRAVALGAGSGLPRSLQGPAGKGLPHHSVDDRRQHGWPGRSGSHGGQTKALLSAGAAHGFHLRSYRRRVGLVGLAAGGPAVRHLPLSRHTNCASH